MKIFRHFRRQAGEKHLKKREGFFQRHELRSEKVGKSGEGSKSEELLKRARAEDVERKKIRRHLLKFYLQKSGFELQPEAVKQRILIISASSAFLISAAYGAYLTSQGASLIIAITIFFAMLFTASAVFYLLIFLGLFIVLDFGMFRRKHELESVLADFIQLTSANVHAGMTLDKALWYAVRPRFGILAREIEMVAKETASGTPLEVSLRRFASKYHSKVLQSSIALIIEGLQAGGEMGPLLNRIASNIKEEQLMIREMAANVSTYAIFISAATLFAAPLLMALSYQLLIVINKLSQAVEMPQSITAMQTLPVAFSKVSITPSQFRLFAILCLTATSVFSAMMISIIKSGDVRAGLKNILGFIAITILFFLLLSSALKGVFSTFF